MRYRPPKHYKEKLQHYETLGYILDLEELAHLAEQRTEPIYLEIGMGRGDFITEHARRFPKKHYIGIEKQEALLISAAQKIQALEISNVQLIALDARQIDVLLPESSVSGIYLNFSDPWSKTRYAKRRLTHIQMLERYAKILKDGAQLAFKTDNEALFRFTLSQLAESSFVQSAVEWDLYRNTGIGDEIRYIQTEYEKKFVAQGKTIYYLECRCQKVLK